MAGILSFISPPTIQQSATSPLSDVRRRRGWEFVKKKREFTSFAKNVKPNGVGEEQRYFGDSFIN